MISPLLRPPLSMPRAFALVVIPGNQERVFVGSVLMMAGLPVKVTRSFWRARSLLRAYPPSVLVADVRPGFTKGLDLARLGRSLRPHMTQLLTSERQDPALQREVEALGAAFIPAPMTEDQLLGALYRTVLREPNADGSVVTTQTRLIRRETRPGELCLLVPVCSSVM